MVIICLTLNASFFFCLGCDRFNAFDGNGHCYLCGSDSPAGSIDDEDLDQNEVDEAFESHYCNSEAFYPSKYKSKNIYPI